MCGRPIETRREPPNHVPAASRPAGACSAMTLVEMMVALGIGTLMMGVAVALIVFAARSFAGMGNYDELNRKSRNALDVMAADIRQSKHLVSYVSNSSVQQLVFTNMPGSSVATFSYNYTNSSGTLTRAWGSQNTVVLSNIANLTFALFTRNPQSNFTFFPATNPAAAKLIDTTWECSLPVGGGRITNTESIQTAKIVVRN